MMAKFKILGLKISDLRAIDLIDVDFRDHQWIEVTGENGGGKSTLIDALFLALTGTKHVGRGYPAWRLIKTGKDRAIMKVVLGNAEREIEVKRSITRKDKEDGSVSTSSSLSIKDTAGEKLSQADLDGFISEFTVDPLSFAKKRPDQQAQIARELAGVDTTDVEKRRADAYADRTLVNRELKQLEGETAEKPDEIKAVEITDLYTQRDVIKSANETRRGVDKERASLDTLVGELRAKIEKLNGEMSTANETLEQLTASEPEESTETVDLQIQEAAETNQEAQLWERWQGKDAERVAALDKSANLTQKIDALDTEKTEMLKASKLPFKNVVIDDEAGLVIGGIPFSQKSTAEQIQISARIGMELAPDLRVICIKEGSSLDPTSVDTLRKLAARHNYQILVERVGEVSGVDKIVLRGGKLISSFEEVTTAEQKANRLEDEL